LTERETEVVYYLSRFGYSNKLLANKLFITEKTVKNHIAKIQEKTNVCSTRELLSMIVVQTVMQQEQIKEAIAL
jgi:DNA-binding CsgD family transcriptional regulator